MESYTDEIECYLKQIVSYTEQVQTLDTPCNPQLFPERIERNLLVSYVLTMDLAATNGRKWCMLSSTSLVQ